MARRKGGFVVIAGPSGVGKSEVRARLADRMDVASFGPDEDGGWGGVMAGLDASDRAIVECCRMPGGLVRRKTERFGVVVQLSASPETRAERLQSRGESEDVIQERVAQTGPLGYEHTVLPDLVVDTDGRSPDEIADEIFNLLPAT